MHGLLLTLKVPIVNSHDIVNTATQLLIPISTLVISKLYFHSFTSSFSIFFYQTLPVLKSGIALYDSHRSCVMFSFPFYLLITPNKIHSIKNLYMYFHPWSFIRCLTHFSLGIMYGIYFPISFFFIFSLTYIITHIHQMTTKVKK